MPGRGMSSFRLLECTEPDVEAVEDLVAQAGRVVITDV